MATFLVVVGIAAIAMLAIAWVAWDLVKNGTILIRVDTVELPSPQAAQYRTVIIDGASYLIVTGHDPGSNSARGVAQMIQRGGDCHVEVDRVVENPSQASGDYIYAFPMREPCTRVTFGKRRVAVAPTETLKAAPKP